MRVLCLVLPLLAACAGIESELFRVELREDVFEAIHGGDRGLGHYLRTIDEHTTRPSGAERYVYVGQPNVASYLVRRSALALGATHLEGLRDVALAADMLLFVLRHDPVAVVRGTAALELGRVVARLSVEGDPAAAPAEPAANVRIHEAAADLLRLRLAAERGEGPTPEDVAALVRTLGGKTPDGFLSAQQLVRALARDVPGTGAPGPVGDAYAEVAPAALSRSVLVALRDVACGDPYTPGADPDPSPHVRADAAAALLALGSAVARDAAVARLAARADPAERDPDVRRRLLDYLGEVGGPEAFEVCLRRLHDVDSGVRLHAAQALRRMSGADVPPYEEAWAAWREANPSWRLPLR